MSRDIAQRMLRRGRRLPAAQSGVSLVELLVSMVILGVITSMILVVWFALQNSFAYSVGASHQREAARDALARMTVAIRGAQNASYDQAGIVPAISVAEGSKIVFNTSYQRSGNADITPNSGSSANNSAVVEACFVYVDPSLGQSDGKIYYVVDRNGNGLSDELANGSAPQGKVIVSNVVNNAHPASLFTYTYFDDAINPVTHDNIWQATSVSADNVGKIYSVQIHVLVDLKPGHSPVYMDLQSTAQPRNMRPST